MYFNIFNKYITLTMGNKLNSSYNHPDLTDMSPANGCYTTNVLEQKVDNVAYKVYQCPSCKVISGRCLVTYPCNSYYNVHKINCINIGKVPVE